MKLEGRTAIVTGAGAGLGRAFAAELAGHGARVLCADVNGDTAEATAADLRARHGQDAAIAMAADVSHADEVAAMVERAISTFGHLDILVNNAGITRPAMTHKMTEENWDHIVDVNQKGTFLCVRAVIPHMKERGYGRIISTSSIVGLYGNFGQTNYVATKAAVIGMTRVWARELGPKGITANAVAPGFIATEMVKAMPEKILNTFTERTPVRRLGEPEDIAYAYLMLASEEASFINGVVLSVDGGLVT